MRSTQPWTPDHDDGLGLSPLMHIRDFDGSLGDYVEALHTMYHATLYEPGLELWGLPLVARDKQAVDGRDMTFWHLITASPDGVTEKSEATRELAMSRCAYLPRVCDVLRHLAAGSNLVYWWSEPGKHVLVSPADFSMIVKLRRLRGSYQIEAAYPTDKIRRRRRTLQRALAQWAAVPYVGPPGTTAPRPGVDRWAVA
jgi:hypothetical protein